MSRRGLAPKDHDGREGKPGTPDGQGIARCRRHDAPCIAHQPTKEELATLPEHGSRKKASRSGDSPPTNHSGSVARQAFRWVTGGLNLPPLDIARTSRIMLTGENGSGKTTLLTAIMQEIGPVQDVYFMPQEIDTPSALSALDRLAGMTDFEEGQVWSFVARLGTDPSPCDGCARRQASIRKHRLFTRRTPQNPSGNGVYPKASLIVLDEPTNHMDLLSVRCLSAAMKDYSGAILAVSHDRAFLGEICTVEWQIDNQAGNLEIMVPFFPEDSRASD